MRVLLLADIESSHTIKWANGLKNVGVKVAVFSLTAPSNRRLDDYEEIEVFSAHLDHASIKKSSGALVKASYIFSLPRLWNSIKKFNPTVIHAHYASSYGLLGAISGYRPFFLSLWGTDVYQFPKKSKLHELLFKFVLSSANKIFSTSEVMREEAQKYTKKEIRVIPFGIDAEKFKPGPVSELFNNDHIKIGLVKSLESQYGVDLLIKAFSILKNKRPDSLKLILVGSGSKLIEYQKLVLDLGLSSDVIFTGKIQPKDVVKYHNTLDIAVYPSRFESFGVAVLESSACEKPVIVSRSGGLTEVVEEGVTGIICEPQDSQSIVEAITKLLDDRDLAQKMGKAGRAWVQKKYSFNKNVLEMKEQYNEIRFC
jgi:glycosyltransferase involved in cell wall biosynthesis